MSEHYDAKELDGYNIKRYDSTMIAVFSHLLEGMKVGNTSKKKNQVKLITELQIVYLYRDGDKLVKEEFRLVEVKRRKDGKSLFFLTNILDLSAIIIADIYKMRWQIEVFFRFLKQEMNLTHFVCNDMNAIQVMIYTTLITAMLILIYKKKMVLNLIKSPKSNFSKNLKPLFYSL